jgi:hypothetical protein
MFYVEDIKEFRLDEKTKYSVRDSTRCKYFDCVLIFQADFILLFEITDKDITDNRICISKVDYFLNSNLIKDTSAERKITLERKGQKFEESFLFSFRKHS